MASDKGKSLDVGWDHFIALDKSKKRVKCKWCNKILNGGIHRGKEHLAAIRGNAAQCTNVPDEIRKQFQQYMRAKKIEKNKARARDNVIADELTQVCEDSSDNECSDDELQTALRASRDSFRVEESQRRGEGSSTLRREVGRSVSMRVDERSSRKRVTRSENVGIGPSRTQPRVDNYLYRTQTSKQQKISNAVLRGIKDTKTFIGRAWTKFFVNSTVAAHAADNIYFKRAIEATQAAGVGVPAPTGYEIYNKYLPMEVEEQKKVIEGFHRHWDEFGCTIMCDGWTTNNRKNIINFLVYCNEGTAFLKSVDATEKFKSSNYICGLMAEVIEEVGASRVVQVISDNGANFKAAGKLIMDQYNIFWTPCAAHCIDLMLEDIGKDDTIKQLVRKAQSITTFFYNHQWALNLMHEATNGRELLRPGITRFATNFITLQSLYSFKDALMEMCLKNTWARQIENLKTRKERDFVDSIKQLLFDQQFWLSMAETIQLFEPLIKVLRMVDSDDKSEMGFLYEAIDRAKFQIKQNVGGKHFKKWWKIIDNRWEKTLHQDIHAAGYFLNPLLQYSDGAQNDAEVMRGLKNIIEKLQPNILLQIQAEKEAERYRRKVGIFSSAKLLAATKQCKPWEWWSLYARDECPNLTPIAVRILSQTVSSSQCERNWTTFELIHTRIRNRLKMDRLEHLVFCHYNMRLRERHLRRRHEEDNLIDLDKIFHEEDPLQPWIRLYLYYYKKYSIDVVYSRL